MQIPGGRAGAEQAVGPRDLELGVGTQEPRGGARGQRAGCSPWHSSQKPGPRLWQWLWKLQPQSREQRGAGGPGAGVGGGRSDVQPRSHTQVKSGGPLHTPWPQSSRHLRGRGGGGGRMGRPGAPKASTPSRLHPSISIATPSEATACSRILDSVGGPVSKVTPSRVVTPVSIETKYHHW